MNLKVTGLAKDELRTIMRPLSVDILRKPLKNNNSLEKRYLKGFRASNATYLQLVPMYFQEIQNENETLIRDLKYAIHSYFGENDIEAIIESYLTDLSLTNCIELGIDLGEAGCEVPFDIIVKLFEIDIDEENLKIICKMQERFKQKKIEDGKRVEESSLKISELTKTLEKKNKEIDGFSQKKSQWENDRNKLVETLETIKQEKELLLGEVEREKSDKLEVENELQKCKRELENNDKTIKSLRDETKEKEKTISNTHKAIKELKDELRGIKEEKELQYDISINRLVNETINDLKEEYDIDIKEFESILNSIDGERNIINIWDKISEINKQTIDKIETSLRNSILDPEIIDCCNDVENNIMAKYVIIKSIKSLYYEYLSKNEKEKKMFDGLQK